MAHRKKTLLAIASMAMVAPLSSCDMSESFKDVANGLLPNLWITITQVIVVLATAVVVIFLAYKPMKKKLKQRQDHIEGNIREAEEKNAKADEKIKEADGKIEEAKKEAGEIIQEAQKTAEMKANDVQRNLALSIETQKEQAHKDIEAERNRMLAEAHDQILNTAIDTSKKILGREINEEDNKKILDDFINQLNEGDDQ